MSINRKELNGLLLRGENINSLENTFAGIMFVETMCVYVCVSYRSRKRIVGNR